ncbi:MAG: hypothetical protein ACLUD2_17095 [Clostridium sp.]
MTGSADVTPADAMRPMLEPGEGSIYIWRFDEELDMSSRRTSERMEALDEQFYVNGYNLDVDRVVQ